MNIFAYRTDTDPTLPEIVYIRDICVLGTVDSKSADISEYQKALPGYKIAILTDEELKQEKEALNIINTASVLGKMGMVSK
jgi:hypothetical protein